MFVAAGLLGACGSAPPSTVPATPRPTPVITPDPHLGDPATANDVFLGLARAGLRMTANNADAGGEDSALVKRINATYLGWPLAVSEYRTSAALARVTDWAEEGKPGQGDPPVAIAGLNILVEWGPTTGEAPPEPDGARRDGLRELASQLDRLLSPLRARAVIAVPGAGTASVDPSGTTEATPAP
jgi:hypothetical protein